MKDEVASTGDTHTYSPHHLKKRTGGERGTKTSSLILRVLHDARPQPPKPVKQRGGGKKVKLILCTEVKEMSRLVVLFVGGGFFFPPLALRNHKVKRQSHIIYFIVVCGK